VRAAAAARRAAAACELQAPGLAPTAELPPQAGAARGLGRIVEKLYANFNRCDVDGTTACFVENVVYEDLLLGNSTIVESREDFREVIQTHPVFVARKACTALSLPPLDLAVRVDDISEDTARHTVGVEWHVELDGKPLAMGRGLSFMRICPRTGLIQHAVDIAEAPWRAVGIILAPFARGFRGLSRFAAGLLLPPLLVGGSSALVLLCFAMVFLDRASMHDLRAGVDSLDDFREGMDMGSVEGLVDLLGELSGRYPWGS